jgi:hypothetical protein
VSSVVGVSAAGRRSLRNGDAAGGALNGLGDDVLPGEAEDGQAGVGVECSEMPRAGVLDDPPGAERVV